MDTCNLLSSQFLSINLFPAPFKVWTTSLASQPRLHRCAHLPGPPNTGQKMLASVLMPDSCQALLRGKKYISEKKTYRNLSFSFHFSEEAER